MCSEANADITEGTTFAGSERCIDRLSHELTCLVDLGVLTIDEEAAFLAVVDDLWALAARARRTEAPAAGCLHELSRMTTLLAADLDLAYQRLGSAA